MKPEQQRIAIAEVCGLFRIMPLRRTTRKGAPDQNGVKLWYCDEHHGGSASYVEVPDYLNDLNAMHEAEQTLWEKDWTSRHDFVDKLARIISPTHGHHQQSGLDLLDATAAQRAEAFLRTINKWQETKL